MRLEPKSSVYVLIVSSGMLCWVGVDCCSFRALHVIRNQRRKRMYNERLFGDHDCTNCDRAGDCPLEGVIDYAESHKEEIDALAEPLKEYVLLTAQKFVDNMLHTKSSEETRAVILGEIISAIVLGYVRAKMEDGHGSIDIPDAFREMDNE